MDECLEYRRQMSHDLVNIYGVIPADLMDEWNLFVFGDITTERTHMHYRMLRHWKRTRNLLFENSLFDEFYRTPPEFLFSQRVFHRVISLLDRDLANIPNANNKIKPRTPYFLYRTYLDFQDLVDRIIAKTTTVEYASRRLYKRFTGQSDEISIVTHRSWQDISNVLRFNQSVRDIVYQTLNDKTLFDDSIFDHSQVVRVFDSHIERGHQKEMVSLLFTHAQFMKNLG